MIELGDVEKIHEIIIERSGGSKGIRDKGILESAIYRPYQTFDGKELYSDPRDKAAAIFESIVSNHPFIDGNKRTAYVLMRLILLEHNLHIEAAEDDKYDFVIKAACGELTFEEIKTWIQLNTKP